MNWGAWGGWGVGWGGMGKSALLLHWLAARAPNHGGAHAVFGWSFSTQGTSIQATASNILNLVNYAAIDTLVNSPTFGQVLSVRPMRSAQLNFRFRF